MSVHLCTNKKSIHTSIDNGVKFGKNRKIYTKINEYCTSEENKNIFVKDVVDSSEDKRDTFMNECCVTEEDTSKFIHDYVSHHLHVKRVIDALSKIHNYVFMTQYLFTTSHSCFLAFSFYYTTHPIKELVKSSPILVLSLYTLFMYCWNGQQLSNKCDELFRALYECPWYKCPRSFKTSLTIMLEFYRRRVTLNGGSFTATLHTFLQVN
nr:olfactory receptor 9 [Matsumurasca onukii]